MAGRTSKGPLPLILYFILINGLCVVAKSYLSGWGVDVDVLIIGNSLLFVITLISYLLASRGLNHSNPHVFVRAMYGSIMIKLFVCMIAAFVYISIFKKNVNKPALFSCMGLYVFYTFMEVSLLTRQMKQKKNG